MSYDYVLIEYFLAYHQCFSILDWLGIYTSGINSDKWHVLKLNKKSSNGTSKRDFGENILMIGKVFQKRI